MITLLSNELPGVIVTLRVMCACVCVCLCVCVCVCLSVEAEPAAARLLMLQLTDGAVELQGMEYQPIPALNAALSPGTKVTLFNYDR